jgi:hypothetical protein
VNGYIVIQQALVGARQDALRAEADTTRLLASSRPLPAVSAGSRAGATTRPAAHPRTVMGPRSLGAAAATNRNVLRDANGDAGPAPHPIRGSAGQQRLDAGCRDQGCSGSIAPAA